MELFESQLDGKFATCPLYGAEFDVTNGTVLGPPAAENVPCYKLHVDGEDIRALSIQA